MLSCRHVIMFIMSIKLSLISQFIQLSEEGEENDESPQCDVKDDSGGRVALVSHAGAESPRGPGVGVLLGLLAALVQLGVRAVPHDHPLAVRVAVELQAGLGAGDELGLQAVVGQLAEVLDTTVVTLQTSCGRKISCNRY